jgi:hypothetical protein
LSWTGVRARPSIKRSACVSIVTDEVLLFSRQPREQGIVK